MTEMTNKADQIVKKSRSIDKITTQELLNGVFTDFYELHGDREYGDDRAIIGGLAYLNGKPVVVVATDKGVTPQERIATHFGSPTPAGYRKALRLAKLAEKFNQPIIFLVNTPGAYPGIEAEEDGQGYALAQNILQIMQLKVPVVSLIFGEGGSGGALALACGDKILMLENSTYSILSPEGFATILWKDSSKSHEAAAIMGLTPQALLEKNIIDGIIPEPDNKAEVCENVKVHLTDEINKLEKQRISDMLQERHQRYRKF